MTILIAFLFLILAAVLAWWGKYRWSLGLFGFSLVLAIAALWIHLTNTLKISL